MADARVHLIISGRVQGVFFRAYTRDVAAGLGLAGWVRNLPGGEVEAVFEGEKKKIEQAIGMCYAGPPSSNVEDIEIEWGEPRGESPDFAIKYF